MNKNLHTGWNQLETQRDGKEHYNGIFLNAFFWNLGYRHAQTEIHFWFLKLLKH